MATIYRKTYTKPLPADAETFTRKGEHLARWKDSKGKTRTAPLTTGKDGSHRISVKVGTYTAKFRDGSGIVREKATGCRDKEAALRVLADLERRAELVKAKVMTAAEDAMSDHQDVPLGEHFGAYLTKLEADGTSPDHRGNVRRCLQRVAADCRFSTLADLRREAFEPWLVGQSNAGMGARTRNLYRASLVAFCNWCVATDRLTTNPFASVKKADEDADRRRQRRSLTEAELVRLLEVARRRPLLDRMTVRRGKRKGEACAKLRPETRAKLERLGRERALIYKTLVLTGLRKGELASLTVGQLDFDADPPYLVLEASDEKNHEGNSIPLRADVAADLRGWLADKLEAFQADARRRGEPIPSRLPADARLFAIPKKLIWVLDRDLKAAGIPKVDDRGRQVDVHALRHTFGTLLSKGGVAPRTAQAAMRHSKIDLTMNVYTDPRLLDVAGAMEVLPALPLDGETQETRIAVRATGTDGKGSSPLAPMLAPNPDQRSKSGSTPVRTAGQDDDSEDAEPLDVSACPVKGKTPLTLLVNGGLEVRDTGLEPVFCSQPGRGLQSPVFR